MVVPVSQILLSVAIVILCFSNTKGVRKYGLEKSVLEYPQRFRELLPDGIPKNYLDFYVPINALSPECLNDSKSYLEGLKGFQSWAVKMLDASSKIPSGMMRGHVHDLGSFDECLHDKLGSPFQTQYCLVHFPGLLPVAQYNQKNLKVVSGGMPLLYPELALSMCLPESCTLNDVRSHYTNAVAKYNATATVDKFGCSSRKPHVLDALDWIAVFYLVILLTIVLASTIIDTFFEYTRPDHNDSDRSMQTNILTSFSLLSNARRILTTTDPNRSLSFVNGIRFLSISWILLGHHYYMNSFFTPSLNTIEALESVPSIHMAWIINGTLSVDTFFVISGCLLSYFFLNLNKDVKKLKFNVFSFYFHRYIRFAPVLLTTILLSATLFNYTGDGPLWNHFSYRHKEFCRNNWWTNIIFLNNYINIEEQCASFTWFLCVDMQLYLLAPLVLIPMRKYKIFPYTILPFLIIAAMTNSFFVSYINEVPAGSLNSRDLNVNATNVLQYTRAHIRVGPWLVGMSLGYILHKLRYRKFSMTKLTATLGWVVAVSMNVSCVYAISYFYQDNYEYEKFLASLYTAVHRTVWSLGIAWIIFACETGYGGPVRKFLSWSFFQPLGKLTFCLYMVHSGFQYTMIASARGPTFYGFNTMLRNVLGEIVVVVILAFVGSLLFEVPFRNLENIILRGSKRKPQDDEELRKHRNVLEQTSDERDIALSTDFPLQPK